MPTDQSRIREILGEKVAEKADTSLRGNSLRRAMSGEPPRTLTPFEWEQWYEENGVPEAHEHAQDRPARATLWRRVKRFFRRSGT